MKSILRKAVSDLTHALGIVDKIIVHDEPMRNARTFTAKRLLIHAKESLRLLAEEHETHQPKGVKP